MKKAVLLFAFLAGIVCTQKKSTTTIALEPNIIISGRVLDASTNEPLGPNALVIETVENDTAAYFYTVTDKDGYFSYPLYGTGHVLKVVYRDYERLKIPIDKSVFEIRLKKGKTGYGKDGVMYQLLEDYRGHSNTQIDISSNTRVPNIRIVKPEEMRTDGEGILIK